MFAAPPSPLDQDSGATLMRSARWVGRVGGVCFGDQVPLRLVLDRSSEPLSGSLEVADGCIAHESSQRFFSRAHSCSSQYRWRAAQTTTQDGLINVSVGDITITDAVDIGVAAQIAANICDVKVCPVVVLGVAVDRSGDSETVCTPDQGDVTLNQN